MTATAKLFMHGRSQAVRLPKEFRMAGTEVSVRREGDKIVLEPLNTPEFDVKVWLAKLSEYNDIPFPDIPDEAALDHDSKITFD